MSHSCLFRPLLACMHLDKANSFGFLLCYAARHGLLMLQLLYNFRGSQIRCHALQILFRLCMHDWDACMPIMTESKYHTVTSTPDP